MSIKTELNQGTIVLNARIDEWAEQFLIDRKVRGLSEGTLQFYRAKLKLFLDYCDSQLLAQIEQLTPANIRLYLLHLSERGHNPGGVHACFRTLRTFLYWWENEVEPDGWKNPIRKVRAPKLNIEPLEPVSIDIVKALIKTCDGTSLLEKRDKAIFMFLLDSGVRAAEMLATNIEDIDRTMHSVMIRKGKGGKPRTVFIGKKTRIAMRKYLNERNDDCKALWATNDGRRLAYFGLRQIVRRRALNAGVLTPKIHSFRRAFALNCLRAGMDIYSLQRLMGHSDLQVLRRYLDLTRDDLQNAHSHASPIDNFL